MTEQGYMSGGQLQQYLNISANKLKYLMEHNIIPHENTGQPTHKYLIRIEDAEHFKQRMEQEAGLLSLSESKCTGHGEEKPKPPLFEATEKNCATFRA